MTPLLARRSAPSRTLERLYQHHARDVYRTALALLRNPEEAEDATQTAFLNAYRALMRGEKPREPRSWMLAIVHNVVKMRHRTVSRRPREVPLDEGHEPAAVEMPVDLEPVLDALAQLPLNQRAAIVMREVEGRSYAEIASVLGVTVSSVEALIFRARRNLRMKREAFGVLSLAPLPASLAAVSGAGMGGAAAVVGSDAVLKIAAVVVAGVVVGGAALHDNGRADAGTDWRSGPAVYRADPASSATPVAALPQGAARTRTAAPRAHRAKPAAAPAARTGSVVVFTPVAPPSGGGSSVPGAHRIVVPMTPRRSPQPDPRPAPAPPRPVPAPKSPPSSPPAAPPTTNDPPGSVTPTVPVELPVVPALPPIDVPQAPPLEAPHLPALPAVPVAVPVLPALPPIPPVP